MKGVGIIDGALSCFFGQSCLFHTSNNANDRESIGIFALLAAFEKTMAQRTAVRPIVMSEILINDAESPVAP